MPRRTIALLATAFFAVAASAQADVAKRPWPPADGPGTLFAHFGEEHINDADGATLMPAAVAQAVRYRPRLLTLSGDKANDGQPDQFELWSKAMKPLDDAGIPYLAAAGNHDRTSPPGAPGGTVGLFFGTSPDSFDVYKEFFKGRPYPWGDAPPYAGIGSPRPADDPEGAAATYVADVGNVRWIFLDNSCWSLSNCNAFQARADGSSGPQMEFLAEKARQGSDAGKLVFVVMHMGTADPRDQDQTDETARLHTMGKGTSPDNDEFERVAAGTGVDAVFVAHIKGQFQYVKRGVPYYIDGGIGGELYTTGPVGTDHGYWHGFRLIRVDGERITTDTVPFFVEDGLRLEGPDTVPVTETAVWQGFGRQPVFNDPAKVERLELRDPDPKAVAPGGRAELLGLGWEDWAFLSPLLLVVLVAPFGLWLHGASPRARRRGLAGGVVVLGGLGFAGASAVAQQEIPTRTGKAALPSPARIFTSANPNVLVAVPAEGDDPRRDARTQTEDGRFRAVCPGRARLSLTSGWEETSRTITVPSRPRKLVDAVSRARSARRGRSVRAVRVTLAQPAVVTLTVRRGGRVVKRAARRCVTGRTRTLSFRPRRAGRYTVEARVSSDRKPALYRHTLRVR